MYITALNFGAGVTLEEIYLDNKNSAEMSQLEEIYLDNKNSAEMSQRLAGARQLMYLRGDGEPM
jgi:hypothetical protein